ncbi:cupin domain-containing protein [Fusobacterium ulcerans]|jgi:transcriptional regulator with XRE-family HTH domain|uniref:helix-turn-helix domain-containing protein n=1 Tax=Fusobacterium ulcerans TaxID=861 RepID=UPI000E51393E|nr:XRE family transcriptional regulator [Fusobacterium ulcerans]RGY65155.1 cupin domain-containing protein [Fusobacterium ulcerans]
MDKEINVGAIIKRIRIEKGLLLKDVAEKCEISSSMLSQIEKGNANPSLNTIKSIAQALEIPLFKFFIEPEKEDRKIINTKKVRYELLSPEGPTNIECMKMIFTEKNAETSIEPMAHKGEEIALLLSGKVKITIGNQSCEMEPGDSVYIPALKPHKWTNLDDGESVVLFSVTPPEF